VSVGTPVSYPEQISEMLNTHEQNTLENRRLNIVGYPLSLNQLPYLVYDVVCALVVFLTFDAYSERCKSKHDMKSSVLWLGDTDTYK